MPDQDTNQKRPVLAEPHSTAWYWRLLGLYQRQTHQVQFDVDNMDDGRQSGLANDWWKRQFNMPQQRSERYRIFDEMDMTGLASSVLDLYAEETTQKDYDKGRSVWIESDSDKMRQAGEECLRNCMVEDKIGAIVRRFIKYGDAFQRLIYQGDKGVLGWRFCPTEKVHRVEDKYQRVVGFKQDGMKYRQGQKPISWPWDYVHFRLLGRDEESGYGTSLLEPVFSPWRQLTLAEDSLLMYRMRRAPDRNLVLVDVGNMEDSEASDYVNQFRKRFRKYEFIDPASPDYRKQYNPLTPMEDIFLPVRGGENNTRVEQLSGSAAGDTIHDINYFLSKFFGAARVPKAYMGFEGDINAKATLLQQDVRFARGCKRIQRAAMYGLRQTLDIHYTLLSNKDAEYDFSKTRQQYLVQMTPISFLDEYERLELIQLRYQIIESMTTVAGAMQIDPKVWATYILLNYAKLPDELVLKLVSKSHPKEGPPAAGGFPPGGDTSTQDAIEAARAGRKRQHKDLYEGIGSQGYYSLSEKEQRQIAEAIHSSPKLRKIIGDIAEYHIDDMAAQQTDPSLLPPRSLNEDITDTLNESAEVIELRADVVKLGEAVTKKNDITEAK